LDRGRRPLEMASRRKPRPEQGTTRIVRCASGLVLVAARECTNVSARYRLISVGTGQEAAGQLSELADKSLRAARALLRCFLDSPPLLERGNNRRSTGSTELALRFLGPFFWCRATFEHGPSLPLGSSDRFASGRTHLASRTTRCWCGVIVTGSHRAEFRKLLIEPSFLFFEAKDGCVNDLVRETWNRHYLCSPIHILSRFLFWADTKAKVEFALKCSQTFGAREK
jgi:hypothetical protein